MSRRRIAVGAGLCLALAFGARRASAGPPMSSANNAIGPSAIDGGGNGSGTSTNFKMDAAAAEEVLAATNGSTATSANFVLAPAVLNILSFPGTITSLAGITVTVSSVTLQWTAPGYDGGVGSLQAGTSYYVRIASYTVPDTFLFSNYQVAFTTSGVGPGALVSTSASGLLANTTYFAEIWTKDVAGNISYASPQSTFTVLSLAPQTLAQSFVGVYDTSATLNWTALAASPSSSTCEGYQLEASTTNFGALSPGGQVISSATANAATGALTVAGLDFGNTYYFRVGSLNWQSVPNYAALSRLNLQLAVSSGGLSFGSIDPGVYPSTVAVSSIVVTNVGNLAVTYTIFGATATSPSSPWTLGVSSGVETALLQGVWKTVIPTSNDFNTPITASTRTSGGAGGNYAGNQNGQAVPPGATRTLWLQFWSPTSTISNVKESIKVIVKAVYP